MQSFPVSAKKLNQRVADESFTVYFRHGRSYIKKRTGKEGSREAMNWLDKCVEVAREAALKAGRLIQDAFYEEKQVDLKNESKDLVTETDRACERIIFDHLTQAFPDYKFLGEEQVSAGESQSVDITDDPTWIVDPLNGTTNFVHKFPFVCVSVALLVRKVPVVGVVYNPILEEVFSATKGRGAYIHNQRIEPSEQKELLHALLATETETTRDISSVDSVTKRLNGLLYRVRSLRMSGSCAMSLCGVACGRLDVFYDMSYRGPWDVAAGALIVQEAGGHIFDPSGKPFDIFSHRICATNSHLKDAVIEALKGFL
ncbi:hypothetical protein R1sor_023659 [Riccia sorocarpa]|uniref:Inositol-1-monophosphatase n=1 Tax=Riccia sorocarpa TaxID=122646 RepID=A0ABD3GNA0_9MARC